MRKLVKNNGNSVKTRQCVLAYKSKSQIRKSQRISLKPSIMYTHPFPSLSQ